MAACVILALGQHWNDFSPETAKIVVKWNRTGDFLYGQVVVNSTIASVSRDASLSRVACLQMSAATKAAVFGGAYQLIALIIYVSAALSLRFRRTRTVGYNRAHSSHVEGKYRVCYISRTSQRTRYRHRDDRTFLKQTEPS